MTSADGRADAEIDRAVILLAVVAALAVPPEAHVRVRERVYVRIGHPRARGVPSDPS